LSHADPTSSEPGRDPTEEKRNSRLVILNGGLMQFAMSFASSETVIPAFIQTLTGSSLLVGLSRSMIRVGWSWPQIFISRVIEEREEKKPLFMWVGLLRAAVWGCSAATIWFLAGERPMIVLGAFFFMYMVTTSLMGVTNVPWMDVIGKTIPTGGRGRIFALRRLFGGGLAIASGGVISYILSDQSGLSFPRSYAVLFMISAILTAVAILAFGLIREPIEKVRKGRLPMGEYLKSGFLLLKEDDDYRRLFILRYIWATAMMGTSFYVPFALSDLGIGVVYIGLFVSVSQAASILSNALWAWVSERWGNRELLISGTYLLGLSILVPITTPMISDVAVQPLGFIGFDFTMSTRVLYFCLTFVFNGFSTSGMFTGRMALVLDLSPPDRRPIYTSFMNTMGVPQGLMPILGGLLAGWLSYHYMFIVSLLFIPPAVILAVRISPSPERAKATV
jgi:MFS family permease